MSIDDFKFPEPTERQCWHCGTTYVGLRVICESPVCAYAWKERCKEIERRHPRSMPSGMIFYQEYVYGNEKMSGDLQTNMQHLIDTYASGSHEHA